MENSTAKNNFNFVKYHLNKNKKYFLERPCGMNKA